MIRARDWRPVARNTLKGFCTLGLSPSGFVFRDCSVHAKGDKRWISLPARPQIDGDGQLRRDPATGKVLYAQVIDIAGREQRDRFQVAALTAIDEMLGKGGGR